VIYCHSRINEDLSNRLYNLKFVYYEEIKREIKRIHIYECRCNERPKVKVERSTLLAPGLGGM
jgi:hypothetical protein